MQNSNPSEIVGQIARFKALNHIRKYSRDRLVFDDQDRPVQAILVLYRPDIYRYAVDLRRTPSRKGPVWSPDPVSAASPDAATTRARSPRRPQPPDRPQARRNDAT